MADAVTALLDEIARELAATARWTGRDRLSPRVRAALLAVPREAFVPPEQRARAHANRALPIGHGQTISQPFVVALMTELLALTPTDRVLEIGTGSGYQTAVLARLARHVYTIETIPELARQAAAALAGQGITNVDQRAGDGGLGWPEAAPFDAIAVTAAAPAVPAALLSQLAPGGRMVVPVGRTDAGQSLLLLAKDAGGQVSRRTVLSVAFVPLTGTAGQ